jgi:hypothetical protein
LHSSVASAALSGELHRPPSFLQQPLYLQADSDVTPWHERMAELVEVPKVSEVAVSVHVNELAEQPLPGQPMNWRRLLVNEPSETPLDE